MGLDGIRIWVLLNLDMGLFEAMDGGMDSQIYPGVNYDSSVVINGIEKGS